MTEMESELVPTLETIQDAWLAKHRGQWGADRKDVRDLTMREVCGMCSDLNIRLVWATDAAG